MTRTARRRVAWRSIAVPYLYMAPFLVLFVVFKVYPLMYGLYISLTDQTLGETTARFVGLANYARLPKDPHFVQSLLNTFQFTLEATIPVLGLPLLLAVLLKLEAAFRHVLAEPVFLPTDALGRDSGPGLGLDARPARWPGQLLLEVARVLAAGLVR